VVLLQAKAAEKEAAKAAKRAAAKEKRAEKAAAKAEKVSTSSPAGDDTSDQENGTSSSLHKSLSQVSIHSKSESVAAEEDHGRSTTGVLASHPQSRDIQIDSFTLLYHGHELLQDSKLELNYGRRYGLLGLNGCGKSTMLKSLAAREVPIPEHIDMYLLDREMPASDKTALQVSQWRLVKGGGESAGVWTGQWVAQECSSAQQNACNKTALQVI
jgi:ATP-binding cassette subfamily F protein 2